MNAVNPEKTLLIGIGNDGRGDDALGWLFADQFADSPDLDVVYRYQLQVEDAELFSHYKNVIVVDATMLDLENGFEFRPCKPVASLHFSTHKIDPATIAWLANAIYEVIPAAYILAIQGYRWKLQQGLSKAAAQNLDKALTFFRQQILPPQNTGFESYKRAGGS